MKYYNGTKLLSMKDKEKNTPELYIVDGNRSAGKSTYYNRYLINRFNKHGEKFILMYRYKYELSNVVDKFFNCVKDLYFKNDKMCSVSKACGTYHELFFNDKSCGYAVALNSAEQIKKQSHEFTEVSTILFDEFQSETGTYTHNEVNKLLSIHTSISRGVNQPYRYVKIILLSNSCDPLNPYYTSLGISTKQLNNKNCFIRGNGFVIEKNYNGEVKKEREQSGISKAFKNASYNTYANDGDYLIDRSGFVDENKGKNAKYLCTLIFKNKYFALLLTEFGIYISDKVDKTAPMIYTVDKESLSKGCVFLPKSIIDKIKILHYRGESSCKNALCQELLIYITR